MHRNSNASCLRKETRQLLGAVLLVRCECEAAGLSHAAPRPTRSGSHSLPWRETLLTNRDADFRRQRCTLDTEGLETRGHCNVTRWQCLGSSPSIFVAHA